jgi:hypothetical protein
MRNRKVSLVETDTANPDVGKAYQKDVKSFSLVNLDENEGWCSVLHLSGVNYSFPSTTTRFPDSC